MIIVELNEGRETLHDIERICEHLIEHEDLSKLMTEQQHDDIMYILRPTLDADQNETEKRAHWQRLLNEFVIETPDGDKLRFHRDEKFQRLYFGDKKGFETIETLVENENPITACNSRF